MGRVEDVMLQTVKIVGLSAVLSAGLVTASAIPGMPISGAVQGKIYNDRVPPTAAPRFAYSAFTAEPETTGSTRAGPLGGSPDSCAAQAWPHIPQECLAPVAGAPIRKTVRTVTVERREGANTSVLVRVPSPDIAQR
jgi:hypothetical protein